MTRSSGEQQRHYYRDDDGTLPSAAYYRRPYSLALDTSPSERFSSIASFLSSISHLESSALLDYYERRGCWAPRRAVVGAEAAWELYPPVAVTSSKKRAKPSSSVDDDFLGSKRPRGPATTHGFSTFCECGKGSPTHGLPWSGVAGVKWCSECPYRPSVAVDMTRELMLRRVHNEDVEEGWAGTANLGLLASESDADADAAVGEVPYFYSPPPITTAIVSRPDAPGNNKGLVQATRPARPDVTATVVLATAAEGKQLKPAAAGGLGKKKRSRSAADALTADDSHFSQRPTDGSPFYSRRGNGDDELGRRRGGKLNADNLLAPAHIEAAFAPSSVAQFESAVMDDSGSSKGGQSKRVCECGDRLPSYGIRGDKTPTWCPICPMKPDGAVNMRARRCECGKHAPSFGPQGGRPRDARWCSKCPNRPEEAVDVKSKRCVCGRAQASIGIAGMGASSATWCRLCPTKPKHAVNVKAKRCECGKVQAYLGYFGGSSSSARWCKSCPNKPEGAVNVKTARQRGKW